jgi:hypothetical protein
VNRGPDLGDYVEVSERLQEFRNRYPDGCLQPADLAVPYRLEVVDGVTFVVVVAAAYRTPDDPRPGIGMAMEVMPGKTPYTRGSEIQNCETSAWGRALIALGAADAKRGIASADEVRNRRAEREVDPEADPSPSRASAGQLRQLGIEFTRYGLTDRPARLTYVGGLIGREVDSSKQLTVDEAKLVLQTLRAENEQSAGGAS